MDTTLPISQLHRIVGEYLADPGLAVRRYSVSSLSVDLVAVDNDAASLGHAYELATAADRYRHVANVPTDRGQFVSVCFRRADGLFVDVTSVQTDPVVVERLRGMAVDRIGGQRVIDALVMPAPSATGPGSAPDQPQAVA
jgi:hypothetical protein